MLIYFDMCSLQRPLDDQSQLRVRLEAEAVTGVISLRASGEIELVSSDALEFETKRNPDPVRKAHALGIMAKAACIVRLTPAVEERARTMTAEGLKPLDALHLSCAVEAGADYFCTCDDRLLRRARSAYPGSPKVVSPLELVTELGR